MPKSFQNYTNLLNHRICLHRICLTVCVHLYVQERGNVYFTDDTMAFPLRRGYLNLINHVITYRNTTYN